MRTVLQKIQYGFLLLCVLACLAGCRPILYGDPIPGWESQALSGDLTLTGSTSMAKVSQALGEGFHKRYPGVQVETGGTGSGEAVYSVRAGAALIGNVSRELQPAEHPEELGKVAIALDGIVLAVHPDNPVKDLTTQQIRQIFSEKISNWSQVGGTDRPITLLGRESASGTRDAFERAFQLEGCTYEAELTSTGELLTRISSDPSAIGYLSLDSLNSSVKGVCIDGVPATEETIHNGTYRVHRPFLQVYRKRTDSRLIAEWFAFVQSEEGQQIIRAAGLVPLGQEGTGI